MQRFLCTLLACFSLSTLYSEYHFISGDAFQKCADYVFDSKKYTYKTDLEPGSIIFVKTDDLYYFFYKYHRHLASPYILLTHNSDVSAPGVYSSFLDDPKLIAWFAQNVENFSHPKLHPIPIGMANRYNSITKAKVLHGDDKIVSNMLPLVNQVERNILLYMNFSIETNEPERRYVHTLFKNKPYCLSVKRCGYEEYLQHLLQSKFILSPRGLGLDCHRTWEALMMGGYPIVRRSSMDSLFAGLPVLLIDDWSEINEEYLQKKFTEFQLLDFDRNKLFIDYWHQKILEEQRRFRLSQ